MATTKRTRSTSSKTSTKTKSAKKAPAKKGAARKTTGTKRTSRKAAAPDAAPEIEAPAVAEPASVPAPVAARGDGTSLPPVEPPARRAVFFDVENTSRAEDVQRVLDHLAVDFTRGNLEFLAVGNWRVIGHEPARMLAAQGASLVHSAPTTGVRDWSDLRIAVAAGVWMATANPGDVVDIVSDDQAFDAVGDVAAGRGVLFRRLSYRRLAGIAPSHAVARAEPADGGALRGRRRRRGGRGRSARRYEGERTMDTPRHRAAEPPPARRVPHHAAPSAVPIAPPPAAEPVQTAPLDELVHVVQELVAASPEGVSLDTVANALRERGFRRKAGSPRLITRLRLIKDIEVARDGRIRLATSAMPMDDLDLADEPEAAAAEESEPSGNGNGNGEAGGSSRRRRRRGGRRRRGRRPSDSAELEAEPEREAGAAAT